MIDSHCKTYSICCFTINKRFVCRSWNGLLLSKCLTPIHFIRLNELLICQWTVRDVTWMSDQTMHLAEWMHELGQVTVRHLDKCAKLLFSLNSTCASGTWWHSAKWYPELMNSDLDRVLLHKMDRLLKTLVM